MKKLYLFIGTCLAFFLSPIFVKASETSLNLKILPMDCVFEVVNDGSNQLHYLTPETCQQLAPLPGLSQPINISGTNPLSTTLLYTPEINYQAAIEESVILDNFKEFSDGIGKQISLQVGQAAFFNVVTNSSTETHSVKIKEVGNDYVIITLASKPFEAKLFVGETKQYDVTEDHKNDIEITLNSISGKVANLTFKQLSKASRSLNSQPTSAAKSSHSNYLSLTIPAAILVVVAAIVLMRSRQQRNKL